MEKNAIYLTVTGYTNNSLSLENTSCSGGTITEIFIPKTGNSEASKSYILTLKELRSCDGFDDVSEEQAMVIIQTLSELSVICYKQIINDRPSEI